MALSPILKGVKSSPNLKSLIDELQSYWEHEQNKRLDFYNWVTPSIKAEFIDGEVVVHSPIVKKHNVITKQLVKLFDDYIIKNDLGFLGVEKIMCRFERNDYEPDLCFFRTEKSKHFHDDQTIFPTPDFVVEILSASTSDRDRGVKFSDYALHGVEEYWIIDPEFNTIEQYFLNDREYYLHTSLTKGSIFCKVLQPLEIDLKAIF
jgi:Uma2 family endonuclease